MHPRDQERRQHAGHQLERRAHVGIVHVDKLLLRHAVITLSCLLRLLRSNALVLARRYKLSKLLFQILSRRSACHQLELRLTCGHADERTSRRLDVTGVLSAVLGSG